MTPQRAGDGPPDRPGRFVVIDGVDGCGKTTQAGILVAALTEPGRPAPLHLREPGSTPLGERLRELVLSRDLDLGPAVEALLVVTARRQMLDERVRPALAEGRDVVCERFHPSTFAYQAAAGGLDEGLVLDLLARWAGEPRPDLVVLLELADDEASERRGAPGDRIEDKGAEYQAAVAAGYRRYTELAPGGVRVARVDGGGDVEDVAARILEEVRRAGR